MTTQPDLSTYIGKVWTTAIEAKVKKQLGPKMLIEVLKYDERGMPARLQNRVRVWLDKESKVERMYIG